MRGIVVFLFVAASACLRMPAVHVHLPRSYAVDVCHLWRPTSGASWSGTNAYARAIMQLQGRVDEVGSPGAIVAVHDGAVNVYVCTVVRDDDADTTVHLRAMLWPSNVTVGEKITRFRALHDWVHAKVGNSRVKGCQIVDEYDRRLWALSIL